MQAFYAVQLSDLSLLEKCVKNCGVNAREFDDSGDTLLIFAVSIGSVKVVEYLVKNGADLYLKNSLGDNALHYAAKWSGKEIVELLVSAQEDLDVIGKDGFTASNYAAAFKNYEAVEVLRGAGASFDIKDEIFLQTANERLIEQSYF
ncbi:ankyrin repeat domain-containing protein [Acidovorax sp. LjRoot117]